MLNKELKLSVAMIGRNERHCLARAIESTKEFADEIIFVDTGSVDDTREIAIALGAKVFDYTWCEDFSAARNECLEYCAGQWIMVLDCDETVYPRIGRQLIERALSKGEEFAYNVKINSVMPGNRIESHFNIRLFRNNKEIRFRNPIHESVAESVYEKNPKKELKTAPFEIRHQGYMSEELNKAKLVRNINILTNWIRRDSSSVYGWYKLGISLRAVDPDRAVACLYRAFELAIESEDLKTLPFFSEMVGSLRVLLQTTHQELLLKKVEELLGART